MIYPKRTNLTDFSDDELLLFDALFDSNQNINALVGGDNFLLNFNSPSHGLNISELGKTINRFVKEGLLYLEVFALKKHGRFNTFAGITDKGGSLWEKEREPLWDKFIVDICSDGNGLQELTVFATSLKIAKEFIKISHACKLHELINPNNLEVKELKNVVAKQFVPWKKFNNLFKITSQLKKEIPSENIRQIDWEIYNKKKIFWRTIEELQQL